jgi:hypothetical protein
VSYGPAVSSVEGTLTYLRRTKTNFVDFSELIGLAEKDIVLFDSAK